MGMPMDLFMAHKTILARSERKGDLMASSWERRDENKEESLYNALGATLNRLIEAEGASNAVIAQGCGEFFAQVLAALSVESGDTQQDDRILSCSGEHRQQVVCVETTEQSFLSQTYLPCMLLPQQIERNVSHRNHIFGGMIRVIASSSLAST